MSGLRVSTRLAHREVRRRPGRTALVAGLVALPVAAMVIAVVLIRTDRGTTPVEVWQRSFGTADATQFLSGVDPVLPDDVATADPGSPTVDLPPGSRTVTVEGSYRRVTTGDGRRASLDVRDLPLLDPITVGIHDLVDGRVVTKRGEIVLGARVAGQLGVGVGDELVLERPPARFQVVGLIEPIGCLSCEVAVVAPGGLDQLGGPVESAVQLIDLPADLSDAQARALRDASGGSLELRIDRLAAPGEAFAPDNDGSPVRWSLVIGALALTVAGIVISAAFAVGARRQLVTLGQLSASGAAPGTVRTALMLQGTITGALGAAGGLVLAAAALTLGQGTVERILDERLHGYTVRPSDIALVVLLGIGAATAAALIPARAAAGIPTLAALAGRRPVTPVPRRVIATGALAFVGGLGLLALAVVGARSGASGELWAYVAILGGVAELLGACALAPVIVTRLEPLAARLRGAGRLGARSLARHRSRTGAVVSAVAAAGALAIAANGLILGNEARFDQGLDLPGDVVVADDSVPVANAELPVTSQPVSDEGRAEIERILPDAATSVLRAVVVPPGGPPTGGYWEVTHQPDGPPSEISGASQYAGVADADLLRALRADDELRSALDETGVVLLTEGPSGPVSLLAPDGRTIAARAVGHRYVVGYFAWVLVTEERVAELGFSTTPMATIFRVDHELTADERGALEDLQWDLQNADGIGVAQLQWSQPMSGPSPFQLELALTGLALVFSLFVVGVSLALAAAESKDERDVLTVAGAPPRVLARAAGARAWLLSGIGGAMAIPVGFLPVVVFAKASSTDGSPFSDQFPLVFPTRTAVLLIVLVPLVVAAASWLASTSAQRLRPVRVSTTTFE